MKRGEFVDYTLTADDAGKISHGRESNHTSARPAETGDVFPLLVVSVTQLDQADEWGDVHSVTSVSGHLFLDGPDTLWVPDYRPEPEQVTAQPTPAPAATTVDAPAASPTPDATPDATPDTAHSYPATDPNAGQPAPAQQPTTLQ